MQINFGQPYDLDIFMQGDFSQNLKLLQKYPSVDVHSILYKAANL